MQLRRASDGSHYLGAFRSSHTPSPPPTSHVSIHSWCDQYSIAKSLESFSWLPHKERSLLHHFVSDASSVSVCSELGKANWCRIIQLATESPSLKNAILAYAAVHRRFIQADKTERSHRDILSFVNKALQAFQVELPRANAGTGSADKSLLAAALFLCLVDIDSHDLYPRSWRVHVEGAKSLMVYVRRSIRSSYHTDEFAQFLSCWYLSVETLTSATSAGLLTGKCPEDHPMPTVAPGNEITASDLICDENFGFSPKLAYLIQEIGAIAQAKQRLLAKNVQDLEDLTLLMDLEASTDNLQAKLEEMANMLRGGWISFRPSVQDKLSQQEVREYVASYQIWLELASLLIWRRLRHWPSTSFPVQQSVKKILDLASQVQCSTGPSTLIAITSPIFYAGVEARDGDRLLVEEWFKRLIKSRRSFRFSRNLKLLRMFWHETQINPDLDWSTFQSKSRHS